MLLVWTAPEWDVPSTMFAARRVLDSTARQSGRASGLRLEPAQCFTSRWHPFVTPRVEPARSGDGEIFVGGA